MFQVLCAKGCRHETYETHWKTITLKSRKICLQHEQHWSGGSARLHTCQEAQPSETSPQDSRQPRTTSYRGGANPRKNQKQWLGIAYGRYRSVVQVSTRQKWSSCKCRKPAPLNTLPDHGSALCAVLVLCIENLLHLLPEALLPLENGPQKLRAANDVGLTRVIPRTNKSGSSNLAPVPLHSLEVQVSFS